MFSLLLIGSLGFWILIGLASVLTLFWVENEKPGWATMTLLATFAALAWFGNFNAWHAVRSSPVLALEALGVYVIAGAAWSVAKWWFHVRTAREAYDEMKREWLVNRRSRATNLSDVTGRPLADGFTDALTVPESLKVDFARYAGGNLIPSVKKEKSRIMMWMMYWPWSMLWTMINDPVKRLFQAVYRKIKGVYQYISNRAFGDIKNDLPADWNDNE